MNQDSVSTSIEIASMAASVLEEANFRKVDSTRVGSWPVDDVRIYEDEYSVVAIAVFDTWDGLSENWPSAQEALVELISNTMETTDAKTWEGYLVLLTPSLPGKETEVEISRIRYDTSRLRKLVATGNNLQFLGDVERVLLPVLPIEQKTGIKAPDSALDLLPTVLHHRGVPINVTKGLIKAFIDQQPLLEFLQGFEDEA